MNYFVLLRFLMNYYTLFPLTTLSMRLFRIIPSSSGIMGCGNSLFMIVIPFACSVLFHTSRLQFSSWVIFGFIGAVFLRYIRR